MKVMTFNLRADNLIDFGNRWNTRSNMVYDIVKQTDCDIIGLQEVTNKMDEDIKKFIRGYHIIGQGRTKNLFVERNTLLIKEKYPILKEQTFWLSKYPNKEGSTMWHSLFPRICTMVICQVDKGRKVAIYNTHLDCLSPVARNNGISIILKKISEQQQIEEMPIILMGDFNAQPNSKVIEKLRKDTKTFKAVQDLKTELYKMATMGGFKGKTKGRHIDYIFVSEELNVLDVEIVHYDKSGKQPSDHYPIMAVLE